MQIHLWCYNEHSEATDALDVVGKGDYFKGYAEIPDALSTALVERNEPRKRGGTREYVVSPIR